MRRPNTIIILDDDDYIVKALIGFIKRLPVCKGYKIHGFTKDSDAEEFVKKNRESILGYIQDINRLPTDLTDRSGITFFNHIIDPFTPWAKTLILSAICDIDVPMSLLRPGRDQLCWLRKQDLMDLSSLSDYISWLVQPTPDLSKALDESSSRTIVLLEPAWDKLCDYLSQNPQYLDKMNPHDFELLAGEIFRSYGWHVDFTARTRDGGYDIIATRRTFPTDLCVLVEAKRYAPNKPVGVETVRSLYGVRILHSASQVVLVTSSYVSTDAKKEFERIIPWELDFIERDKILEWCKTYGSVRVEGYF